MVAAKVVTGTVVVEGAYPANPWLLVDVLDAFHLHAASFRRTNSSKVMGLRPLTLSTSGVIPAA